MIFAIGKAQANVIPAKAGPSARSAIAGTSRARALGGHANLEENGAVEAVEGGNAAVAASVMRYNPRAAKGR
jgi:hypothetical protein